jgi:uncharacterized membrane protein (DUF106 family)
MCSLDKKQVITIVEDVKQASITITHLADDLIDHICCEVEVLMDEGKSFKQAYEIVKKQTGISVLKKIQEDTKYLTDKNYRLMKTTMKITGNISLAMIMFGTVFKIMHWPGAGVLLVLGFFNLCAVFFPIAVYVNYKNASKKKNLILHLAVLISGIIFMLGVIFKIQHWPNSGLMLFVGYLSLLFIVLPILLIVKIKNAEKKKDKRIYLLGIIALTIFGLSSMFKMFHWPGAAILMLIGAILLVSVFLPIYTWRRIKLEGKITGQFIYTITVSMFLVLFTSLLALNISKNYIGVFVEHGNNEKTISSYLENKNANTISEIEHQADSLVNKSQAIEIKQKADLLCDYIVNLQKDLISVVEKDNEHTPTELLDNPNLIYKKDNMDYVNILLLGPPGNGKAKELKEKLSNFKKDLSTEFKNNAEFNSLIDNLVDVSNKTIWGEIILWENYQFYNRPLISTIGTLNEIKTNLRMAESIALKQTNNITKH